MKQIKSIIFLLIPFIVFFSLLHFLFLLLCHIEGIPKLKFGFMAGTQEIKSSSLSDDIPVYAPSSSLRKSLADGTIFPGKGGIRATYNSGFRRTSPVLKLKPKNTYRIITAGDSFTWGWMLEDDETFPSILEKKLNSNHLFQNKFEVLNSGMTATTITNSLESLENYDFDFQPDMVILTFYENDINDLRTSNVTSPGLYKILKNIGWFGPIRYFVAGKAFKLKKLLTTNFEGFQEEALVNGKKIGPKKDINHIPWPDDPEKFRERSAKENFNEKELLIHYYLFGTEGLVLPYTSKDDENTWKLWKEWERHLDKLNELCKSRKIKLIIMAYPSYPRIIETEFDNEKTPENIIKELCEKKGISFIDPLPEFRKAYKELKTEKKSLYFGPADWHANKNGSEVIARLLEKVVQNELSK